MDIVNCQTSTFAPAATLSFTILSTLSSCLPLVNMISIRLELSWCSSWSVLNEMVIESHLELMIGPIVVPAFSPSPTFRSSTALRNLLRIKGCPKKKLLLEFLLIVCSCPSFAGKPGAGSKRGAWAENQEKFQLTFLGHLVELLTTQDGFRSLQHRTQYETQ